MTKRTLVIQDVDFELLEKQQLTLARHIHGLDILRVGKSNFDALHGLLNMLDGWSDIQRNAKHYDLNKSEENRESSR